ncbi:MAG: hypothetical protein Ct9H300mP25_04690 [Acidobacteriota bacterium]|nr:MAG: hypothetical protein Ct9H300mP25_04690 [Acidobacteriota bacterium]
MRIFIKAATVCTRLTWKWHSYSVVWPNGRVILTEDFPNEVTRDEFDQTSPPVVFEDLVIVGSRVPDRVQHRFDTPGSYKHLMSTRVSVAGCFIRFRNRMTHSVLIPGKTGLGAIPDMRMFGA